MRAIAWSCPRAARVDDEAHGVNGDALGRERLRRHHRIALAGLLAVADEHDDALLGVGREIVRGLSQRIGDRRVALRLGAVDRCGDGAAARARGAERHGEMGVLAILLARRRLRAVHAQRKLRLRGNEAGHALDRALRHRDARLAVRQLGVHAAGGVEDEQHGTIGGVAGSAPAPTAGSKPPASATRFTRMFFARNAPLQVGRWPNCRTMRDPWRQVLRSARRAAPFLIVRRQPGGND